VGNSTNSFKSKSKVDKALWSMVVSLSNTGEIILTEFGREEEHKSGSYFLFLLSTDSYDKLNKEDYFLKILYLQV
jgi:hypothetical protein